MTFFSSLWVSAGTSSPVVSEAASSVTAGAVSSTAAVGSARGLHLRGDVQVLAARVCNPRPAPRRHKSHRASFQARCRQWRSLLPLLLRTSRKKQIRQGSSVRHPPQTRHLRLIRHGVGRDPGYHREPRFPECPHVPLRQQTRRWQGGRRCRKEASAKAEPQSAAGNFHVRAFLRPPVCKKRSAPPRGGVRMHI